MTDPRSALLLLAILVAACGAEETEGPPVTAPAPPAPENVPPPASEAAPPPSPPALDPAPALETPAPGEEERRAEAARRGEEAIRAIADRLRGAEEDVPERALRDLALLIHRGVFRTVEPMRNPAGLLVAEHVRTGLRFVLLPGGRYRMGAPESDPGENLDAQRPAHFVAVPPFLLCATECTQAAFGKGGGEDLSRWKGPDLPAGNVSFEECRRWCAANGLRLPSEAEWEYAARAGSAARYSHGDDEAGLATHAVHAGNSGGAIRPAASLAPNAFGLFDMAGNAFEWCEDAWRGNYRGAGESAAAHRDPNGHSRAYRSGSFRWGADACRPSFRSAWPKTGRDADLSFRPAAGPEPPPAPAGDHAR